MVTKNHLGIVLLSSMLVIGMNMTILMTQASTTTIDFGNADGYGNFYYSPTEFAYQAHYEIIVQNIDVEITKTEGDWISAGGNDYKRIIDSYRIDSITMDMKVTHDLRVYNDGIATVQDDMSVWMDNLLLDMKLEYQDNNGNWVQQGQSVNVLPSAGSEFIIMSNGNGNDLGDVTKDFLQNGEDVFNTPFTSSFFNHETVRITFETSFDAHLYEVDPIWDDSKDESYNFEFSTGSESTSVGNTIEDFDGPSAIDFDGTIFTDDQIKFIATTGDADGVVTLYVNNQAVGQTTIPDNQVGYTGYLSYTGSNFGQLNSYLTLDDTGSHEVVDLTDTIQSSNTNIEIYDTEGTMSLSISYSTTNYHSSCAPDIDVSASASTSDGRLLDIYYRRGGTTIASETDLTYSESYGETFNFGSNENPSGTKGTSTTYYIQAYDVFGNFAQDTVTFSGSCPFTWGGGFF